MLCLSVAAIFEVTEKGRGYYKTNKDDRDYFRANLQKIEAYEINPERPDLEGTREGHLKTIRERSRREIFCRNQKLGVNE